MARKAEPVERQPPKPLGTAGRVAAFAIGGVFALAAALTLLASLVVHGPSVYTVVGLAVVALVGVMLVAGLTRDPQRWPRLRIATSLLCGLGAIAVLCWLYVPAVVLDLLRPDEGWFSRWPDQVYTDAAGMLLVALLLLLPASIPVLVVARPRRSATSPPL